MSKFPLNPEQREAVNAREGCQIVKSGPGSGKTRTTVERVNAILEEGYPTDTLLALTFTREAAQEMSKRAKLEDGQKVFRTFHSLCLDLIHREAAHLPFTLLHAPPEPGQQRKLLGTLCRMNRLDFKKITTYISAMKRENLTPDEAMERAMGAEGLRLALAYKQYETKCREEGWLDFDSILIEAVKLLETNAEVRARWQFKFVLVDEAQDTDTCQPPGTLVEKFIKHGVNRGRRIETKSVPIETLKTGDCVVTWRRQHGVLIKKSEPISVASRRFDGDLIEVSCGRKRTKVTPDHKLWVTLNGKKDDTTWLVYLMWRKDHGFRVGQCAMRYAHNTPKKRKSMNGLGARFAEERADLGWILRVERKKEHSCAWEQIISCKYGIPYATYGDKTYNSPYRLRNAKVSSMIFANTNGRGKDCLSDHGLEFEQPLYVREGSGVRKSPSKRYFETSAINLIPDVMSLPSTKAGKQDRITDIQRIPYKGVVYSMNVPIDHSYVADGLVVKNCQWRLVDQISKEHGNVCAVGDENQLIYEWRGAEADGLSKFEQRFPGCRTIYLFRNYRSTKQIVEFCKKFAPKKSELIDRMVSECGDGPEPQVIRYGSDSDEASRILSSIVDPEHSAILVRTNRQLARFENACIDRGIKYNLLGKSGFWTQPEVRYLLAYVQASIFPTDAAVKTIVQSPFRETKYLKKKDLIAALDKYAKEEKFTKGSSTPYVKLLGDLVILRQFTEVQCENIRKAQRFIQSVRQDPSTPPTIVMQNILDRADIKTYYETEEEGDGDNDAVENINELYKVAARFKTVPDFIDHARKAIAASRRSKQSRLSLSTVHQSKGKEWDYVYVAGVNQDVIPHKRGQLMEERRIMYVALTRAAKQLFVSFFGAISPFLKDHWTPESQKALDEKPLPGFNGQPGLFEGLA